MNPPIKPRESGSALIVVLSVIATLTVAAAVSMEYTTSVRHNVQRTEALQSAITIGDGVLDHSYSYWREICRSNTDAALDNTSFQNIPLPTQSQFPNVVGFTAQRAIADLTQDQPPTVSNFQVLAIDPQLRPIASGSPACSGNWPISNHSDIRLSGASGRHVARPRRQYYGQGATGLSEGAAFPVELGDLLC